LSVACSSSLAIASVVSLAVRTGVPFDHQRRQPFLRSPHMVGHAHTRAGATQLELAAREVTPAVPG
jgi:hypothetical protein